MKKINKKDYKKKWNEQNKWRFREIYNPKRKDYLKKWAMNHPLQKQRNDDKYSWNRKIKILREVAGNKEIKCVCCGIKDPRVLQVHHASGDGERDPKFYHNTYKLIRLNNFKDKQPNMNLEIRCANCNILAEYEAKRRYPWLIGFDDNFNPIWKEINEDKIAQ
uniref:Uncharacterized protein n=1 Tax=viral metagenome TaxID=1070528 RepID=A0A6H1Z9I3_9ZZZZ